MTTFSVKNFERFQHYKDRAPPWIKLYNELLDDYDFGLLPDASKMHLIAIWLLASRSENKIPYDPTWVARRINATEPVDLAALAHAGFIVTDQPLQTMEQVASKPLSKCLSREREEGETEESREEKKTPPVAGATRGVNEKFEEFWKERPRRDGDDPRKPAEKKFLALVKTGVDPDVMISGAKLASASARERGIYGTKFVPQTIKWLNDQRFVDYAAAAFVEDQPVTGLFYAKDGSEQLDAWDAYTVQTTGKHLPRDRNQGWHVTSEWPPGYEPLNAPRHHIEAPRLKSMGGLN